MLRYLDAHATLSTLRSGRLWTSRAGEFNDPYEYSMIMKGQETAGLSSDFVRKTIDQNVRVLCTSNPSGLKKNGDILMWSHYAKSHSGFRLHLNPDVLDHHSTVSWEVEYDKDIPTISWDIINEKTELEAFYGLSTGLRSKAVFWSYENEMRYYYEKSKIPYSRKDKVHYIPLKKGSVNRIDVGISTPDEDIKELFECLSERKWSDVRVFFAYRAVGQYGIKYEENPTVRKADNRFR